MQRNNLYNRPNKPRRMVVPSYEDKEPPQQEPLKQPVMVDRATECHVTPPGVAANMFYYADIREGHKVLEPSGGTGNLAFAIADRGHAATNIIVIERHHSLIKAMRDRVIKQMEEYPGNRAKDMTLIQSCFLEWADATELTFDRVVMNPPFRKVKQHIRAAEKLLKPDGVLVALVPVTFKHPEAVELEKLPNDTFASAKVYTKIIRIEL